MKQIFQQSLIGRACAVSVSAHLCALLALGAWSVQRAVRSPGMGADSGVVVLEATFTEPTPPSAAVEFVRPQEQVLIMPQRAEVLSRRFVETPSSRVPLEQLLTRDVLDRLLADEVEAAPAAAKMEKERVEQLAEASQSPTERAPQNVSRPPTVRRPTTANVKVQPVAVDQPKPMPSNAGLRTGPRFAGNRPPSYPALARRNRWEGNVLLRLFIDANGAVTKVEVVRSSGHPILDAEAAATVRTWRGSPATLDGRPVPTTEELPVHFRLQQSRDRRSR